MSVTDEIAQDAGRTEGSPERPGARLKKARETRGLDLAKVSAELRLSQRIVSALEADLYRELPEPAFVRGYMRRYAQLVQLSPDDIAARFDQAYAADAETPPPDARASNPLQLIDSLTRRRLPVGRLLGWLSLLLVLVLAGGVFFSQLARPPALPVVEAVPAPVIDATVSVSERPASPAAPAVVVSPSAAVSGAMPTPTVLPAPTAPQSVVAVTPAAASVVAQVPAVGDRLVLALSAESWVSVRDADGRQLASSNIPAGRTLTLEGRAPFAVNLGNAPAVALSINGRAVDLVPHTRGAVATLTVNR